MKIYVSGTVEFDVVNCLPANNESDQSNVFPLSVIGKIDEMPKLPEEIQYAIDAELKSDYPIASIVATLAALGGEQVEVENSAWDWSNGAPDTLEIYQPLDLPGIKEALKPDAYEALIEGIAEGKYNYNWAEAISAGSREEIAEMNVR